MAGNARRDSQIDGAASDEEEWSDEAGSDD